mmetsp:Transcript_24219/g.54140  ORF Transcript_24219/g.54140 Transcript_24219/m.54140 type:complete len:115 (+) Transcript_24219:241-585(+)
MILRDGKTQPQWAERLLESVVHSQNTGRLIRRSGASLHPHSIESYRYGTAPIDTRIAGDTMRRFKRNLKHSGAYKSRRRDDCGHASGGRHAGDTRELLLCHGRLGEVEHRLKGP